MPSNLFFSLIFTLILLIIIFYFRYFCLIKLPPKFYILAFDLLGIGLHCISMYDASSIINMLIYILLLIFFISSFNIVFFYIYIKILLVVFFDFLYSVILILWSRYNVLSDNLGWLAPYYPGYISIMLSQIGFFIFFLFNLMLLKVLFLSYHDLYFKNSFAILLLLSIFLTFN